MTSKPYKPCLVIALLLAAFAFAIEANEKPATSANKAARVFLSSGDVIEVLCSSTDITSSTKVIETTLVMRDSSGIVMTVADKEELDWGHSDTRISDGKTTIEIRTEIGYYEDKLLLPMQVRIGKDIYRTLLKDNTVTDDQKKLQAAIAKLPRSFREGLKHLVPLGVSPFHVMSLNTVEVLFESPFQTITITSTTKLEPAEIDALTRDAVK